MTEHASTVQAPSSTTTAERPSDRRDVNSSARYIFDTLRLVLAAEQPIGIAAVAEQLGLPTTTAQRALKTLEVAGYITRPSERPVYEAGFASERLVDAVLRRYPLRLFAMPTMRRLAGGLRENVLLHVRLGWYTLRASVVAGGAHFISRDFIGLTVEPLHRTNFGAVMLASMPPQALQRYAAHRHRLGDDTASLDHPRNFATVKGQRVAVEESVSGFVRLSAAIMAAHETPVATLTFDGFSNGDDALQRRIAALIETTEAISRVVSADPEAFRGPYDDLDADFLDLG